MTDNLPALGRPKGVKKVKKKNKKGAPLGNRAILADYKARMLASPKSRKVLQTVLDAAMDDNHKHQAVAWKLVMDRIVPVSSFAEREATDGKGLQITIAVAAPESFHTDNNIKDIN